MERIPGGASVTAKYKLNGDESRIARDLVARASWVEGNIVIISHHARDPGVTRTLTVAMAGDTMIVEGSTEGGLATQAASALTYRRGPPSPGAAITRPTLVREEKPQDTNEARRAEIQGIVAVEAVVLEDGTVGEVRILKSLDKVFGLDTQALAAAKKFRFWPALDNGKPVRFKVVIQLEFRLHRPEAS